MRALLGVLLLLAAAMAADGPAKSATIAVPEIDQLQWSNLRLQAANLRLQAEAVEAKANDKLAEIKARLGGSDAAAYDFQISSDGKMQLVRKPEPKATAAKETAKP